MTWSRMDLGAGPRPKTVQLPDAIWVLPASWISLAVILRDLASTLRSISSSSERACRVILAWPRRSQRARISGLDLRNGLVASNGGMCALASGFALGHLEVGADNENHFAFLVGKSK